jgi:hypothetical protein
VRTSARAKDVQRFAGYVEDYLRRIRHELAEAHPSLSNLRSDAVALKLWARRLTQEFPGPLTERLATSLTEAVEAIESGQDLRLYANRAWDQLQEWAAVESEAVRA